MTSIDADGIAYRQLSDEDALALSAIVLPHESTSLAQRFADILRR
jgi:hypothetical protein